MENISRLKITVRNVIIRFYNTSSADPVPISEGAGENGDPCVPDQLYDGAGITGKTDFTFI